MLENPLSELSEMYKFITVDQLCQEIFAPEMNLHLSFWYWNKVKLVFLVISCRENGVQSKIFVEMLAKHIN